jgi:hypothetical protein
MAASTDINKPKTTASLVKTGIVINQIFIANENKKMYE